MVAAFLKDTPSPEEMKPEAEDHNNEEDRKGKRARGIEDTPSDTNSEYGRRIRQRMQGLEMEDSIQMEVENDPDLGLRQAVPQQPPN
ncbi:hypothetical protein COLO4_34381 [Corchorus olitorius]|uniref:Uncharacterized protein n=1 Tax=Corchorus olitorius TaxID=93759 RepID=A0A1R3GL56_9ROSI|nr:hypothetical protein COLO4_34381 [Corchorus olitorius]